MPGRRASHYGFTALLQNAVDEARADVDREMRDLLDTPRLESLANRRDTMMQAYEEIERDIRGAREALESAQQALQRIGNASNVLQSMPNSQHLREEIRTERTRIRDLFANEFGLPEWVFDPERMRLAQSAIDRNAEQLAQDRDELAFEVADLRTQLMNREKERGFIFNRQRIAGRERVQLIDAAQDLADTNDLLRRELLATKKRNQALETTLASWYSPSRAMTLRNQDIIDTATLILRDEQPQEDVLVEYDGLITAMGLKNDWRAIDAVRPEHDHLHFYLDDEQVMPVQIAEPTLLETIRSVLSEPCETIAADIAKVYSQLIAHPKACSSYIPFIFRKCANLLWHANDTNFMLAGQALELIVSRFSVEDLRWDLDKMFDELGQNHCSIVEIVTLHRLEHRLRNPVADGHPTFIETTLEVFGERENEAFTVAQVPETPGLKGIVAREGDHEFFLLERDMEMHIWNDIQIQCRAGVVEAVVGTQRFPWSAGVATGWDRYLWTYHSEQITEAQMAFMTGSD